MNFFQAQDRARHNTALLVAMFVGAVVALVAGVYVGLHLFSYGAPAAAAEFVVDRELLAQSAGGVLLVVAGGCLYKVMELSGGGAAVAESLGGKPILPSVARGAEKRLLNIVEEMAIAAGAPVPVVYVIPDGGVNAFAAGTRVGNAVIGVTSGALRTFSRDEMQGVIAHEFSHILNGDMRLNIRLIGVIHGLMVLGLAGYYCLRLSLYSSAGSSRSSRGNPLPLIGLGIVLVVAGFAGAFFGNAIRAAVSRQREFLADAAAVQFTRNPHGIGGALEKIGMRAGVLEQNRAAEYAHMFFANGVLAGLTNLFASHPPTEERLRRIMPGWDGATPLIDGAAKPLAAADESFARERAADVGGYGRLFSGRASRIAAADVIAGIGGVNEKSRRLSEKARQIPPHWRRALEDPYAARALIYAMLLDRRDPACRQRQLDLLAEKADEGVYDMVLRFAPDFAAVPRRVCLSLLPMAMPALRRLSPRQYQMFADNLGAVIAADNSVELFEWCLQAVVAHGLHDCFGGGKIAGAPTRQDADYALSLLARAGRGAGGSGAGAAAFAAAHPQGAFSEDDFAPQRLFLAMQRLSKLKPKEKENFVRIAVAIVAHDGIVDGDEEALLRAYLLLLDCPLPPVVGAGD